MRHVRVSGGGVRFDYTVGQMTDAIVSSEDKCSNRAISLGWSTPRGCVFLKGMICAAMDDIDTLDSLKATSKQINYQHPTETSAHPFAF